FKVDLKSYTNYYPYGMAQPKREWGANYRYGYNGVEEDDELKGDKNSLSTYYRLYDPRLALWLGIDPVVHESESPYAAMGGNPILYADPSGAEGEIQEFTSDISDPNKNKDLNGLANGTTVKYNGRDIYKDEGKWAWTVNVKSVAEVTGERSGKTQTVTDNQPHSEGESGFMGSAYYHAGRWYDENAYRDLMWSAVRIARNHPSAQGMKLSDIGFTPQSLLDPNNSSNHFEFLGQADRELFGTNERVAFGDGSNPYLGELYAPSNTGMDGTGLMAVWGWGGLGRSLARGLSRSLIGAISKKAVALEVAETLAPEAGMGVTNAGEMLGNFGIPKLYTYTNGGKSVFVTPHAMKHLEELAANGAKLGSDYLNLLGQIHQKALHSAIDDVLSRGAIQFRKMYYSGGNEIMFGAPRTAGELPAVIHFR
ncbi:MAG: hypothetical protein JNL32_13580, partial [Candidatus Kapabacteria bacterium]|nr:hypothetical protein [Candidatus Kapabacteria bacterium]